MFGKWIKKQRLKQNYSLRSFARLIGEDPSNWSKIERNLIAPPQNELKILKIATVLGISRDSDEFSEMVTLANVSAGRIPEYLMREEEIIKELPAFLRTLGSVKPTPTETKRIIRLIQKEQK